MKKALIVVFSLVLFFIAACAEKAPKRDTKVGRAFLTFNDASRPSWGGVGDRPLATTIWYPTVNSAREELWQVGVFNAGWSAFDSPILERESQYPLIVLSHGTGGAALQLSWLAERLASDGYIVVAVNHHGNTAFEDALLPQGFVLWWERARDMSVVIDKIVANPRFGKYIDSEKIGVAGFSLGGYAVLAVAGAITSLEQKNEFCAQNSESAICRLPPEAGLTISALAEKLESDDYAAASFRRAGESYKDSRVKAVFSIAPVHGPALTEKSLAEISVPVSLVVGSRDQQALARDNAKPIADLIVRSEFEELNDVSHYTFLSVCNAKGRQFVKDLCADEDGVVRKDIHRQVADKASRFFDENL